MDRTKTEPPPTFRFLCLSSFKSENQNICCHGNVVFLYQAAMPKRFPKGCQFLTAPKHKTVLLTGWIP